MIALMPPTSRSATVAHHHKAHTICSLEINRISIRAAVRLYARPRVRVVYIDGRLDVLCQPERVRL